MTDKKTKSYWNGYYKKSFQKQAPPSQFAAFVASEVECPELVVDFGCGNGRDSLFFAGTGSRVLGVDQSEEAISVCTQISKLSGFSACDFVAGDIGSSDLHREIEQKLSDIQKPLIYARFFIHAITDEDEDAFLEFSARNISTGLLALEFRTQRDEALNKVTPGHFRRFVDPMAFAGRAREKGLEVSYFVEGFGLAKYRQDDAHVARFLMKKAS